MPIRPYRVVDIHTHLRMNQRSHLDSAASSGIYAVVHMANAEPCLDNLEVLMDYRTRMENHGVRVFSTGAITIGRAGQQPVDFGQLRGHVVGFSDDGDTLEDLDIFAYGLKQGVLMMMHAHPEVTYVERYLRVHAKVGGRLHLQHISRRKSLELIRDYKKSGQPGLTVETCPHYWCYHSGVESHPVSPPLGTEDDTRAVMAGLADGTIDIIASDYAPLPRPKGTGFASYISFFPLCWGLVLDGVLTLEQLREKISFNPIKLVERSGFWV